jgi:hypothetical protein
VADIDPDAVLREVPEDFTPGPWAWGAYRIFAGTAEDAPCVCPAPDRAPDARLVAHAPTLVAALRVALEQRDGRLPTGWRIIGVNESGRWVAVRTVYASCARESGHLGNCSSKLTEIGEYVEHLRAALEALDAAEAEVARLRCELARVSLMAALDLPAAPGVLTEIHPPRSEETP